MKQTVYIFLSSASAGTNSIYKFYFPSGLDALVFARAHRNAPGTAPGLQLELKERDIRITESNQRHLLVSSQKRRGVDGACVGQGGTWGRTTMACNKVTLTKAATVPQFWNRDPGCPVSVPVSVSISSQPIHICTLYFK